MIRFAVAAIALALAALMPAAATAASGWSVTPAERVEDLTWLADKLKTKYAYRDKKRIDVDQIVAVYRTEAEKATTERAWITLLERVLAELYDHHATLGVNTAASPPLVPSGTDIWAELQRGQPTITQIRPGSVAARAGLRAGMTVKAVNGRAIGEIIDNGVPQTMSRPDAEAGSYVLRVALAGSRTSGRKIQACTKQGACKIYALGPAQSQRGKAQVTSRKISRDIGYIRIENSLDDRRTVDEFDRAVQSLADMRGLILDLRNTPSGGDTNVAEPILGRFIDTPVGYQRVFEPAPGRRFPTDSWVKDVDPRGARVTLPLVVLVDHWTGSMGEGMAIGFDALKRGTIVGTKMAGLLGGIDTFVLPHTQVPVRFPIERLYHTNGTPREDYEPNLWIDPVEAQGDDPILAAGLDALRNQLAAE